MGGEFINFLALLIAILIVGMLAAALLWRVSTWQLPQAEVLTFDEGLSIGSRAPDIAAYSGNQEFHLSFGGGSAMTFVVLGKAKCEPCNELLRAATSHPATSSMRLLYVSDSENVDVEPEVEGFWELYTFHDEKRTREQWEAPVSPYFHVVDGSGRIAAKGIANSAEHLDRLFSLAPGVRALNLVERA